MLTLTCTCTYTILYNYIINIDLLNNCFHILYHRLAANRSISDHTYNCQRQLQTDVLRPCPGQEVYLVASDSQVVGRGMVMEGNKLHGHEIPRSFVKVAITHIEKNVPPLLRTTFDDPYLTVGGFTAWPACQCANHK